MLRQPTILRSSSQRRAELFDSQEFDAIRLVNTLYPDEASLTDLDKFIGVLKKQIQQVDHEIFNAVRSQGGAHARARQDLSVAHGQITELFSKVRDIQRKSEESEAMVQEICRDIKKLDYAKRHLTNSITALRRLAMLTAAVT
ncbi:Vacuolar protein sorting-associated protein 53, partial [Tetrabaena socialis]